MVTRVYARYLAPEVPAGATDEQGRRLKPRFKMRAYLVDLSGDSLGLPDYDHVLLHQVPPVGWWMIKEVDDHYLQRIQRYQEQ
ncbi:MULTISPECIES: hypothetical protein [unclassified Nonomuraea]|uniref:hypothetical protein n=1 Tax=unclassified Nonomuraea TaxID=2593643 RepID=UPI0033D82BA3